MIVQTPAEAAGVECPKATGKMKESASCFDCPSWGRCMSAILAVL